MIAPYWDDIDITRFGNILYRLTTSASLLQRVCDLIKAANFGSASTFSPTLLFIVTWDRVAEYNFFAGAEEVRSNFYNKHCHMHVVDDDVFFVAICSF